MNREIMSDPARDDVLGGYYTELSSDQLDIHGQLLDQVISFAFDTLGARRLDLRVTPASRFQSEPSEARTRSHRPA